jgi:hypothetical protein
LARDPAGLRGMRSLAPRRITACARTPDPRGPHFAVLAETGLRAFVTSSGARQRNGNRNRTTIRAVRAVGPCTSEW